MPWTRRQLLSALAAGGAAAGAGALGARRRSAAQPHGAGEPARPNLCLVVFDDVGREGLAPYGGTAWSTPAFDGLAARGLLFDHLYSTPLCGDSRGQILSGRYAFRTGLQRFPEARGGAPAAAPGAALPGLLRQRGYATAFVGKSHLPPERRGDPSPQAMGATMREQGWDRYAWAVHTIGRQPQRRYWGGTSFVDGELRHHAADEYMPDLLAAHVSELLAELPRPFFLQYSLLLAHRPFQATPLTARGRTPSRRSRFPELVHYLDALIGRLASQLDASGLSANTLLLAVSDNGTDPAVRTATPGGPVAGGKGQLSDAGTRVPGLAHWPGVVAPGVNTDLVDLTDLLPTFLDVADGVLAGQPPGPRADIDGVSFAPQLAGRRGAAREWHFNQFDASSYYIRTRRWKLYGDGRLYDLQSDPAEERALRPPQEPREAAEARERLDQRLSALRSGGAPPHTV